MVSLPVRLGAAGRHTQQGMPEMGWSLPERSRRLVFMHQTARVCGSLPRPQTGRSTVSHPEGSTSRVLSTPHCLSEHAGSRLGSPCGPVCTVGKGGVSLGTSPPSPCVAPGDAASLGSGLGSEQILC